VTPSLKKATSPALPYVSLLLITFFPHSARAQFANTTETINVWEGATLTGSGNLFTNIAFDGVTLTFGSYSGTISWSHIPVDSLIKHYVSFEANSVGGQFFIELKNSSGNVIHEDSRLAIVLPDTGGAFRRFSVDLNPAIVISDATVTAVTLSDSVLPNNQWTNLLRNFSYSAVADTNAIPLEFDYGRYLVSPGAWTMPAPFLDILPALFFTSTNGMAFAQNHSLFLYNGGSTTALLPARFKGAALQVDLLQQGYLSIIYSSCLQQTIDLDLRHKTSDGAEVSLIQNIPSIGATKIRVTLPRTGGFPYLQAIPLTNFLIPNLENYKVSTVTISDPSPVPACLEILALGFPETAPSQKPQLAINNVGSSVQVFFHNGFLEETDELASIWRVVPEARNPYSKQAIGARFFRAHSFTLPTVPQTLESLSFVTFASLKRGYVNLAIKPGFQFVAAPLISGQNSVSWIFKDIPSPMTLLKLGEPCVFQDPAGSAILQTFVTKFGITNISDIRACLQIDLTQSRTAARHRNAKKVRSSFS
jgi:hypothetical protein